MNAIGRFLLPLRVESSTEGLFRLTNTESDAIPAAFLFWLHEGGGMALELGPIAPGGSVVAMPTPKERNIEVYRAEVIALMVAALERMGLRTDEATALVTASDERYFRTRGFRIVVVLPRSFVDSVLSTRVVPQPLEWARAFLGHIEILAPPVERALVGEIERAAAASEAVFSPKDLGTFFEPKARRAYELLQDPRARAYCERLITEAVDLP